MCMYMCMHMCDTGMWRPSAHLVVGAVGDRLAAQRRVHPGEDVFAQVEAARGLADAALRHHRELVHHVRVAVVVARAEVRRHRALRDRAEDELGGRRKLGGTCTCMGQPEAHGRARMHIRTCTYAHVHMHLCTCTDAHAADAHMHRCTDAHAHLAEGAEAREDVLAEADDARPARSAGGAAVKLAEARAAHA